MSAPTYRTLTGTAAQRYQEFFVPSIAMPAAGALLDAAALVPGESVLDVACGTGVITRLAAEAVGSDGTVVGLDVATEMLDEAAGIEHDGARIEWQQGDAASLPHADETFDAVLCQMGLMFVEDQGAALAEMYRVVTPGGRVVVNTPGSIQVPFRAMAGALSDHVAPELGAFVHAVFSLDDPVKLGSMFADAGFDDVSSSRYTASLDLPGPAEFLWRYVSLTPMAPLVAESSDATKEAVEARMTAGSASATVGGRLVIEQPMVLVVARRL